MRLLPNRRASIDHATGPSIASARRTPNLFRKSLLFVIVNVRLQANALENDLQTKLNFTWRSEREHAGPHADAIRIVCRRIRAVDRSGGASKETGHDARRQIEVRKIEDVVKPD